MCGISCYFGRDSFPPIDILSNFIKSGSVRGSDGFGLSVIKTSRDNLIRLNHYSKLPSDYVQIIKSELDKDEFSEYFERGDIILSIHRAAPETEVEVSEEDLSGTLQPIVDKKESLILVHNGSVSDFIIDELKNKGFLFETKIDSEAIIKAYLMFGRDIRTTMTYLSGGFSFVMYDGVKKKLYIVSSHNPLYMGYVKGYGLFINSMEEPVWEFISKIKGRNNVRGTMNIWEDYYAHPFPPFSIHEIDIESGMSNQFEYEPRYKTPKWDPFLINNNEQIKSSKDYLNFYKNDNKDNQFCTLVSASGGLDSSTSLAALKAAEMNPVAVHFKYGHRGQDAEELGIKKISDILGVKLIIIDIEDNIKNIDDYSMLTNSNHEVTTGERKDLKTLAAWTCFRNTFFLTYMGAYAERFIVKDRYDFVYYTGGFMNLTESGVYPDNSERFIQAFSDLTQFGSICGKRIIPLYGLCNLLKVEQYILLNELHVLKKIFPWLVSCDRPKVISDGKMDELLPANCCAKNKHTGLVEPACGSGRLAWWAANMAGFKDCRTFYEIKEDYDLMTKEINYKVKHDIDNIIDKLMIPENNKEILRLSIRKENVE